MTFITRQRLCFNLILLFGVSMTVLPLSATAGVVLDGTLGPGGALNGPNYQITNNLGKQLGPNLFHSFRNFNLSSSESAVFSGPGSIRNIISRVTGGEASTIDGLISSTISGANLYFINPAGVIFGEHAKLDVSGSFHATTADYIRLGEDGRFDARYPANSILTIAPPSAFGFLGNNPGSITLKGSLLKTGKGSGISLVGGDISIEGSNLSSSSGIINIFSAASAGEALFDGTFLRPDSFSRYGDIRITDGSHLLNADGGAGIFIRGGGLYISTSLIEDSTTGSQHGGDVTVDVKNKLVVDGTLLRAVTRGPGKGGDVSISAGEIEILGGAQIGTLASDLGDAGDVAVEASGTMRLAESGEFSSGIYSYTSKYGDAGDIHIRSAGLKLDDAAMILNSTVGEGNRGDILIDTGKMQITASSTVIGANITMDLASLEITDGAYVWSPAPGSGAGRAIRINARESVLITGGGEYEAPWRSHTSPLYTGIHTDVFLSYNGDAGDIVISSPLLRIENSGQIGARTYTNGKGGNITVDADRVELLSGGQIASDSFGSSIFKGPAGSVTVNAKDAVIISGEHGELWSGLSSVTRSNADAGKITVKTPFLSISESGAIVVATGVFGEGSAGEISITVDRLEINSFAGISSASSGYGEEGSINISASEGVFMKDGYITSSGSGLGKAGHIAIRTPLMTMNNSVVSATAYEDLDAGDISIVSGLLELTNNSIISSRSLGYGKAGAIFLQASDAIVCDKSSITTESERSTGGNIEIAAGQVQLTGGSHVTATVAGGSGSGGNVSIRADVFAALEDSDVTARADQGYGGNIVIDAQAVLLSPDVDLNASSNISGKEGKVEVRAPYVDISGKLAEMPTWFLSAETLLPKRCAESEEEASSFVIRGRDGLPVQPDSLLQGRE